MISLQHGLIIFVFVTFVTWLFVYFDGRINDKTKKTIDFFKIIVLTNLIAFAVVYILTWLVPNDVRETGAKITGAVSKVAEIGEEMLTGPPPF